MNIIKECKDIEKELISWRRELHKIPEIGFNLEKTIEFVVNKLQSFGITTRIISSCSAVVGIIEGENAGKTIAIRADMDALPIKEETGLSFTSTNENMHSCGHDAHVAMLLATAKVLNNNRKYINGNIKLFFQAAEETSGGAKPMIDYGVMENPHVDAVFGQHVGNLFKGVENGQVGIFYGNMMASQDHFVVKVKGKGGHGAYPGVCVDPILISAHMITAIKSLMSSEINGLDLAVLTIGKIKGGNTYNVIPDTVEFEGSVRVLDEDIRVKIEKRFKEIVKGISTTFKAECEIQYINGFPVLTTDNDFTDFLKDIAGKILGKENVIQISSPSMGSEDMSFFLKKAPGTYFFLASKQKDKVYPHHNSKFDIDESSLWKGTAIMAQTAIEWLMKNR